MLRVMLLILSIIVSQIAANLILDTINKLDTSKSVDETTRYQKDRGKIRIKTEHFKYDISSRLINIYIYNSEIFMNTLIEHFVTRISQQSTLITVRRILLTVRWKFTILSMKIWCQYNVFHAQHSANRKMFEFFPSVPYQEVFGCDAH